eukprot:TRINITY_DN20742_c0_g1_i1.p1 TRINITY_DN20742_c0_g1~~TRINITY_DN20742_c0_g1_i1.p1  ORF type:complete len:233 (-),score=49.16 TRINITY_DN20742_c0_g1_i1:97-774(-)
MIRRPPRSTRKVSSAASDVYKRQDITVRLKQKIRIMNDLLETQGNELYRISETSKFEEKISDLHRFLVKLKTRAKHLTHKLQKHEARTEQLKNNYHSVSIKVSKIKTKKQKPNVEIYVDCSELKDMEERLSKILIKERDGCKKETRDALLEIHCLKDKLRKLRERNQFTGMQYKSLLEKVSKAKLNEPCKRQALSLIKERSKFSNKLLVNVERGEGRERSFNSNM